MAARDYFTYGGEPFGLGGIGPITLADKEGMYDQQVRSYSGTTPSPFFLPLAASAPPRFSPNAPGNYAIFDVVSKRYVSPQGNPWTGDLPGGLYAVAGKIAPKPAAPAAVPAGAAKDDIDPATGKPKGAPRPLEYVQQPGVRQYTTQAIEGLPAAEAEEDAEFTKWKNKLDADKASSTASMARVGADAADTAAAQRAEIESQKAVGQAAIARTEAALKANVDRRNQLDAAAAAAAAATNKNIMAIANNAYGFNMRGGSARDLLSSTNSTAGVDPLTGSTAQRGTAGRIAAEAFIPAQERMLQVERELIAGRGRDAAITLAEEQNQARFNVGVQQDASNRGISVEQWIADHQMRLQNMTEDQKFRYLAYEANIPGLSQQLRSGQISIAAALAQLDRSAADYGYYQPFDPNEIPPTAQTFYNQSLPARSYSNPTQPGGGDGEERIYGNQGTGPTDAQIMANPSLNWARYQQLRKAMQTKKAAAGAPFNWADESTAIPGSVPAAAGARNYNPGVVGSSWAPGEGSYFEPWTTPTGAGGYIGGRGYFEGAPTDYSSMYEAGRTPYQQEDFERRQRMYE